MLYPSIRSAALALPLLATTATAQRSIELPREIVPYGEGEIRAVADFDGDGELDLLVSQPRPSGAGITRLRTLLGRPDGSFVAGTDLGVATTGYEASRFAMAGDVTGDGNPDVVTDLSDLGGVPGSGFRLYRNLGNGIFSAAQHTSTGVPWARGALSDWNGDGVLEVLAMELGGVSSSGTLRRWSWQGTQFVSGTPFETPSYFNDVSLADIDGDGLQDAVFGDSEFQLIHVLRTLPSGDLVRMATLPVAPQPGSRGRSPVCGDVDGDGDQDVVVAWSSGIIESSVVVLHNDGSGGLVAGPTQVFDADPGGFWAGRAHLADWDLDGDLDVLLSYEYLLLIENRGAAGLELIDAFRMARPRPQLGTVDGNDGVGSFDFDHDGFPDFIGARALLLGDGLFRRRGFDAIISPVQRVIDYDDDGAIDLLDSGGVLWRQRSAGRIEPVDLVPSIASPLRYGEAAAFGDFDGDGYGDLLVPLFEIQWRNAIFRGMRLLAGQPSGELVDRQITTPVQIGDTASFLVEPADLDGDGDLDLAATGGWWENDGSGRFPTVHADWSGVPLQLVDVDADGRVDVLTRDSSGGSLRHELHRNTPTGFVAELLLDDPDPASYTRALLVDVDDDGDLDFACGHSVQPSVELRLNGSGGFTTAVSVPSRGLAHQSLLFDDFDGDGRTDLAGFPVGGTTSAFGLPALVWQRSGSGLAYSTPRAFISPEPTFGAADIDGDGDLDALGRYGPKTGGRHFGAAAGSFARFGDDQPGPSGVPPVLGVEGPVRAGGTIELRVRRGLGGAPCLLVFGTGPAAVPGVPVPGLTLYVSPVLTSLPLMLSGPAGLPGAGAADLPIPVPAVLHGQRIYVQGFPLDGLRLTGTAGLELGFGG